LETRPVSGSTPLVLASDGYYDPVAGRPFVRERGLQNEYEFQLFFYDSMAGFGKGLANSAWQQVVALAPGAGEAVLTLNGISPNSAQGQWALEHLNNPFRYNNQTQAIFGQVGNGIGDISGIAMAGAGSVRTFRGGQLGLFGDVPSASPIKKTRRADAETFITYTLERDGKTVYVGMATGKGTPEEVLAERLRGKRHDVYTKGDTAKVTATQGNLAASQGAEDVWYEYHKRAGAALLNKRRPLSERPDRIANSRRKIQAYADDLRR